jgi:hypothetical protein
MLRRLRQAIIYAAIVLAVAANLTGLATLVIDHHRAFDFDNYLEAARRFPLGTLYDWHEPYAYRYAPQLAPILGWFGLAGVTAWRLAHFAALAVLPSRRLAVLLLVSYPFWFDVVTGNLMVFVLLAASWAYRGNYVATIAYMALCVLVPRPIMLPLLAWILWQRPAWRLPFLGILTLGIFTTLPTGYFTEWVGSLFKAGPNEIANDFNLSPSQIIGVMWLVVGVPLAGWLTMRRHLGWASLAISPYLLPYYVQMLGLELVQPRPGSERPSPESRATSRSARSIE